MSWEVGGGMVRWWDGVRCMCVCVREEGGGDRVTFVGAVVRIGVRGGVGVGAAPIPVWPERVCVACLHGPPLLLSIAFVVFGFWDSLLLQSPAHCSP